MTHTSLDGQPLRGLWSALDSREETTTMQTAPHIIESLDDRDGYVALGYHNSSPGADDEDTIIWAMEATRARVADTATEADHSRILGWVRWGEAMRRQARPAV